MGELTLKAPAKLNLTLDILRRREDGYHDLRMVMQSISLCDTVTVRTETGGGGMTVDCGGAPLPAGPENLAWKAAAAFFAATGCSGGGVELVLQKRIPAQAGMAGGSADAAAVLRALKALCRPALSGEELEKIGAKVGSDVPFCVRGGTALAEGRGERLHDFSPLPACWIVLCKPNFGLPTPALFARVRVEALCRHPDTGAMEAALAAGDLCAAGRQLCNVFEEVLTPEERFEIEKIENSLRKNGALGAAMTGSGPTVFGLFSREREARQAEKTLKAEYSQVFLANPI